MNMPQTNIPLVSIICLTFNQKEYISQALDGFLIQRTQFPFEIIVHDDISTDGTSDIVRDYAARYSDIIMHILPDENRYSRYGLSFYLKYVLPHARGKYIALCDGDDYWTDPLKLQKQVDVLEADPGCGLVYTKAIEYIQKKGCFSRIYGRRTDNFASLAMNNDVPAATICMRRELLEEYNREIDPVSRPEWHPLNDYQKLLWTIQRSKFGYIDEITTVYRVLGNSLSHNAEIEFRYRLGVMSIMKYFLAEHGDERLTRKVIGKWTVSLVPSYFQNGNYREVFRSIYAFIRARDWFNVIWTLGTLLLTPLPKAFIRMSFSVRNRILAPFRKYH